VIDRELIRSSALREDRDARIRERFVRLRLGPGETVGILAEPLDMPRDVGWVICPSFAHEPGYLWRIDAGLSRALASLGFPVLRFHGQGYGDSELTGRFDPSISSHRRDAEDAIAWLADASRLRDVVPAGTLLGGTIAAMTAARLGLPAFAALAPAVDGARYLKLLLRNVVLAGITRAGVRTSEREIRAAIRSEGWANLLGFRLSAQAEQELGSLNLCSEMASFRGDALVIGVTRRPGVPDEAGVLSAELNRNGGQCAYVSIADEHATLGRPVVANGLDLTAPLAGRLIEQCQAWALSRFGRPT
jgi:alpha/beta superfamily hydrolase